MRNHLKPVLFKILGVKLSYLRRFQVTSLPRKQNRRVQLTLKFVKTLNTQISKTIELKVNPITYDWKVV